jgi:hypothetical protein
MASVALADPSQADTVSQMVSDELSRAVPGLLGQGWTLEAIAARAEEVTGMVVGQLLPRFAALGIRIESFAPISFSLESEAAPPAPPAEAVYEMLWDCAHCGTKKLLGLTHRHCPTCGALQNAAARYFPSDDEKVAVHDHVYVGRDKICPYCQSYQSRNAKCCTNCGGPIEGGKDAATRQDQVHAVGAYQGETAADAKREFGAPGQAPPPAAPPPPPSRGPKLGLVFAIIGGVLLLGAIGLICTAIVWKKDAALAVSSLSWQRDIDIERFGPVSESAWCDSVPFGGSVTGRHKDVRSTEKIQDGEDCKTRKVDQGNGTFKEKRECTPKYKEKPIYADKCDYAIRKWAKGRTATASGSSADTPKWPDPGAMRTGECDGCERQSTKHETYTVKFRDKTKNDESSCTFDQAKWSGFKVGAGYNGKVGVIGGILDCSSLVAK